MPYDGIQPEKWWKIDTIQLYEPIYTPIRDKLYDMYFHCHAHYCYLAYNVTWDDVKTLLRVLWSFITFRIDVHHTLSYLIMLYHDDIIKWKHFPCYWPFVRGIHRSPVNSPHKGQWHGALMFSLICAWINGSVNTHQVGHLRRHHAHYYVMVMLLFGMVLPM